MSNDKMAAATHPCDHYVERYDAHDSVWRCVLCGHMELASDADWEVFNDDGDV